MGIQSKAKSHNDAFRRAGNQNIQIEITIFKYRLYWVIFYYNPEITTKFGNNQIIFNSKFGFIDIFEEYMEMLWRQSANLLLV